MMSEAILVCVLSSLCTLLCTVLTVRSGNKKISEELSNELRTHNTLQDERIRVLTEKVERHNNLIERMYRVEGDIAALKAMNHTAQ